ncbi:MAG TPA: mannose-1-phosphate guanylyltransferase [bacterium]|nr:mannose-1-phosphate guanylyltransferase [bacterium]
MSGPMFGVIMAGGCGARLWPQSRRHRPKHLLRLVGDKTMLEITVERISGVIDPKNILVVTLAEQANAVSELLPLIPPGNIIAEPVGRNTAPCIGLAAIVLRERCPDATMAVMPADHVVADRDRFEQVIRLAARQLEARPESLIAVGVAPKRPSMGFGYIEKARRCDDLEMEGPDVFEVSKFVEKPSLEDAREMLADGSFLWNAGMFFWRAERVLQEIAIQLPELGSALESLRPGLGKDGFDRRLAETYAAMKPISIDYGVMQKAEQVLVIESDMGWDDVGSWESLASIWQSDEAGCASNCEFISIGSNRCIAFSDKRLVAMVGVEDVVVVDSDDAILICKRDRTEEVRTVVEELKRRGLGHLA